MTLAIAIGLLAALLPISIFVGVMESRSPTGRHVITPSMDLAAFAREHGVRFVRKDRWWLTRWINRMLFWIPFDTGFWTTIGRTVAYPVTGPDLGLWQNFLDPGTPLDSYLRDHRSVVEHEFHHCLQHERWGLAYSVSYLLLPLPVGLAWFRWLWERQPYTFQLRHYGDPERPAIDRVVDTLWSAYLCWPKAWMRRWFQRELLEDAIVAMMARRFGEDMEEWLDEWSDGEIHPAVVVGVSDQGLLDLGCSAISDQLLRGVAPEVKDGSLTVPEVGDTVEVLKTYGANSVDGLRWVAPDAFDADEIHQVSERLDAVADEIVRRDLPEGAW